MRLSIKKIVKVVRWKFQRDSAFRRFMPRSYKNPEPRVYDFLYSRWRKEYTDPSGRVLDTRIGGGLTGLDLYWLDKKAKWRTRNLIVVIVMLVVAIVGVVLWIMSLYLPDVIRGALRNIDLLSSLAMILLTLALVIITWRYVQLTSGIVSEMRWARRVESEPLIFMQVRRELKLTKGNDNENQYETEITAQNIGRGAALGLSLNDSSYGFDEAGNLWSGGGAYGEVHTLAPGEQQTFSWRCDERQVTTYKSLGNYPFLTLQLYYRDIFDDEYTLTQDYTLWRSGKEAHYLHQLVEFRSTPAGARSRFDHVALWGLSNVQKEEDTAEIIGEPESSQVHKEEKTQSIAEKSVTSEHRRKHKKRGVNPPERT